MGFDLMICWLRDQGANQLDCCSDVEGKRAHTLLKWTTAELWKKQQ
jgi:hypothetical protein